MCYDYIVYESLKRLREEQSKKRSRWEPVPLQLPLEEPYWPMYEGEAGENESESSGQVIIIDMGDYHEVRD